MKSKGKVCIHVQAKWLIRLELIPVSLAWSDWEYFYSPLDGMLVHHRVTPGIKFAGTHTYIWVERGTVRVKCLAQEHNTMSLARARTRTTRSGAKHINHEATAPPTKMKSNSCLFERLFKIKKNGIFLFGVSLFVREIMMFLYYTTTFYLYQKKDKIKVIHKIWNM